MGKKIETKNGAKSETLQLKGVGHEKFSLIEKREFLLDSSVAFLKCFLSDKFFVDACG